MQSRKKDRQENDSNKDVWFFRLQVQKPPIHAERLPILKRIHARNCMVNSREGDTHGGKRLVRLDYRASWQR